jgi:hypothetical protein
MRNLNETSGWSQGQNFTLALPQPSGLAPNDPNPLNPVSQTPTFCWDILSVSKNGVPIFYPWKYRVEVSRRDAGFSPIYDSIETLQNCWTPQKSYDEDTYYWRVAGIDGNGQVGAYSSVASFIKQYPRAYPRLPANSSTISTTPIFTWTAKDGITPSVSGAAKYRIEVYTNAAYTDLYDSATTVSTTFTPVKIYAAGTTCYWRVAIMDANEKPGPFTNAWVAIGPFKTFLPAIRK